MEKNCDFLSKSLIAAHKEIAKLNAKIAELTEELSKVKGNYVEKERKV